MAATTNKTGPRGDYAKTEQRRTEILTAALEVFSTAGYHKGSLRDVATQAGLSQAGLLHHFPNKSELLMGVLEWRDTVDRQRFEGVDGGLSTLKKLLELVEHNQTVPNLIELFVTVSAEATFPGHPAHTYFLRRYDWSIATVRKALEQADAAGQLRAGVDCTSAARKVIAVTDGLQVQWLYDRSAVDMVAELHGHMQSLLTVEL
ncbi:TetR/AcrR family transcriptional regulator [Streptomyces fractus]|uniref:TetR/AcrR family transcriptional regulator n=1 Tax=Streptomyces fractus TaxID=641806 RepID=UPI003CF8CC4E